MDAALLSRFKLRLANLSQRNRALKLGRLSALRDVDINDLAYIEGESPVKLLDKIIAGKEAALVKRFYARDERANKQIRRITAIYREARLLFEETGAYDLYMGYPFVEGKFTDGTVTRCPVLLFPVELSRGETANATWKLSPREHGDTYFNPTFFRAFEKYNELSLPDEFWDEALPDDIKTAQELTIWLYDTLKKYHIDVDFNSDVLRDNLWPFRDLISETMKAFPLGQLKFQPYAVLGLFPQTDSALIDDYRRIEEWPGRFMADRLFAARTPAYVGEEPIDEKDRYFPLSTDASQEAALLAAKRAANLVVHGPPGTGKSQLIVNLVCDYLARGRNVLVVSQKRAALDVVHKRLSGLGLGDYCALLHDYADDRATFYKQLAALIQTLDGDKTGEAPPVFWNDESRFITDSAEIDELVAVFDQQNAALTRKLPCGLSPYQLYLLIEKHESKRIFDDLSDQTTLADLEKLFQTFKKLRFYADCLDPQHPWSDRFSFAIPTPTTLSSVSQKLKQIVAEYAEALKLVRAGTFKKKFVLESPELPAQIAAFRAIYSELKGNRKLFEDWAIYLRDKDFVDLNADYKEINKLYKTLSGLKLFKINQLDQSESVSVWLKTIDETSSFFSRLFSGKRREAKKALTAYFEKFGKDYNDQTLTLLRSEIEIVNQAQNNINEYHANPFWEELCNAIGLPEWGPILESKRESLAFIKRYESFKVFPDQRPSFLNSEVVGLEETAAFFDQLEVNASRWQTLFESWKSFFSTEKIEFLRQKALKNETADDFFSQLSFTLNRDFEALQSIDELLAGLNAVQTEIWNRVKASPPSPPLSGRETVRNSPPAPPLSGGETLVVSAEGAVVPPPDKGGLGGDALERHIRQQFYQVWLENAERRYPALRKVSERSFDHNLERYRQLKLSKQETTVGFMARRLQQFAAQKTEYNRAGTPVNLREILHQVTKKRQVWPIRKLTSAYWDRGLAQLAPCLLVSPETASAIFPIEPNLFDLVIFDEASQCPAERAFPVLLRGKQMVVAGDGKQLPPMDLFRSAIREENDDEEELDIAVEAESLLHLAEQRLTSAPLLWHYRSRHEALIHFSNYVFYDGKLMMTPAPPSPPLSGGETTASSALTTNVSPPDKGGPGGNFSLPPISYHHIENGKWENNANLEEAKRIVARIEELLALPHAPTIGVVTFNYHQQQAILDVYDQRLNELRQADDTEAVARMASAFERTVDGEFEGLFVKNIENVQGDERDVIIFSVGYAPDATGKIAARFGWLNQMGGENRLNVAVTRAKEKIELFVSFLPDQLTVDAAKHNGPRLLKRYLHYSLLVSSGKMSEALDLVQTGGETNRLSSEKAAVSRVDKERSEKVFSNAIADFLANELTQKGFEVRRNVGASSFKIDLVVGNLAVICEGDNYFTGLSSHDRLIYRYHLLEKQGWRVMYVFARNFCFKREDELKRILANLK